MVRQEGLEPPLNPLQCYDVEDRSDTGALIGGRYPIRTDGRLLTVAGFQDRCIMTTLPIFLKCWCEVLDLNQ